MGEVRLRVRAKEKPISAVPLARDRLLLVLGREALASKFEIRARNCRDMQLENLRKRNPSAAGPDE